MNAMIELVVTEDNNGDVPVMMALVNAISPENLVRVITNTWLVYLFLVCLFVCLLICLVFRMS